jgi:hypothetical protein
MNITVNVTGSDQLKSQMAEIGRQAPFATSKALNAVANDAQAAIRQGLAGTFTLRREQFVSRTIYRFRTGQGPDGGDFATKASLRAIVRVNPSQDFLAKFEDGGRKTPVSGRNVAIPLPGVRKSASTVIPARMRPSKLQGVKGVRRIDTPSGAYIVRDKGREGRKGWRTEFLYRLKASVPIRPMLRFGATAEATITKQFAVRATEAIEAAMRTAR